MMLCNLVLDWVTFGMVVSPVVLVMLPDIVKLVLYFSAFEVVELHVIRFGCFGDHCFGDESLCR